MSDDPWLNFGFHRPIEFLSTSGIAVRQCRAQEMSEDSPPKRRRSESRFGGSRVLGCNGVGFHGGYIFWNKLPTAFTFITRADHCQSGNFRREHFFDNLRRNVVGQDSGCQTRLASAEFQQQYCLRRVAFLKMCEQR